MQDSMTTIIKEINITVYTVLSSIEYQVLSCCCYRYMYVHLLASDVKLRLLM